MEITTIIGLSSFIIGIIIFLLFLFNNKFKRYSGINEYKQVRNKYEQQNRKDEDEDEDEYEDEYEYEDEDEEYYDVDDSVNSVARICIGLFFIAVMVFTVHIGSNLLLEEVCNINNYEYLASNSTCIDSFTGESVYVKDIEKIKIVVDTVNIILAASSLFLVIMLLYVVIIAVSRAMRQ